MYFRVMRKLAAPALGAKFGGRQQENSVRRRDEYDKVEFDVKTMAECVEMQTCEWTLSGILASSRVSCFRPNFSFLLSSGAHLGRQR